MRGVVKKNLEKHDTGDGKCHFHRRALNTESVISVVIIEERTVHNKD